MTKSSNKTRTKRDIWVPVCSTHLLYAVPAESGYVYLMTDHQNKHQNSALRFWNDCGSIHWMYATKCVGKPRVARYVPTPLKGEMSTSFWVSDEDTHSWGRVNRWGRHDI